MSAMLDRMDRKILDILQKDCTMPVAEIGKQIGLSTTPCWRRIQKLEEIGVIQRRVALLDAKKVNVGVTVFVSITTSHHTQEWLDRFHEALEGLSRGGRVLPHERAGRLSAARGGARHRAL